MVEVIPHLAATLSEMRKNPDHKVIVFFVAARVVQVSALDLRRTVEASALPSKL